MVTIRHVIQNRTNTYTEHLNPFHLYRTCFKFHCKTPLTILALLHSYYFSVNIPVQVILFSNTEIFNMLFM